MKKQTFRFSNLSRSSKTLSFGLRTDGVKSGFFAAECINRAGWKVNKYVRYFMKQKLVCSIEYNNNVVGTRKSWSIQPELGSLGKLTYLNRKMVEAKHFMS